MKLGLAFANLGEEEKACQVFVNLSERYDAAPASILRRAEVERERIGCAAAP